jgi:hypothetical protein
MPKSRYFLLFAMACLSLTTTRLVAEDDHHYSSIHTRHEVTPHLHKACHIFLTSELLYWTTKEKGLEYGMRYFPNNSPIFGLFGKISRINPEFHLGYRNGIKHEIDNSRWDLNLVWTSYANSTDDRARVAPGQNFAVFFPNHAADPIGIANQSGANAHWHLDFNSVDFEVGYNLGWKSRFGIRPFAGVKYAKIEQKIRIDYLAVVNINNFFGNIFTRDHYTSHNYGLRFGANSQLDLGSGFKVFINAAVATLWNSFDLMHNENPQGSRKTSVYHESFQDLNPEFEVAAGIGWHAFFKEKQYFLDLKLGWEQQTWISQHQVFKQVSIHGPDQIDTQEHNMSFAGPTFSATFGF